MDDDVTLGENIVFVLGPYDHFTQRFAFFSQLCDHVIIKTNWSVLEERTDGHEGWLSGAMRAFIHEALALSGHNINLVSDEENMNPQKITRTPENAGIDPSTMKMKKWYLEPTREDDDPHFRLQTA